MSFELTILGSNSARPAFGRFTTSQYLDLGSEAFLIDAGEGCQIQLSNFGLKSNKISNIFISHLHGDHILGLPGLIGSMNLGQRNKALTVYAPNGLKQWIEHFLEISGGRVEFPLNFVELNTTNSVEIYSGKDVKVIAFPVKHRVMTYGFRIDQVKNDYNIDPSMIEKYALSIEEIKGIKSGMDVIRSGKRIPFDELTFPKAQGKSYAYCADTDFTESFLDTISEVDLMYHEATYLKDLEIKARERMHSTAKEAATIALKAKAKKLIIGHYSSRYKDLAPLLEEASAVFSNTQLAIEGETHSV